MFRSVFNRTPEFRFVPVTHLLARLFVCEFCGDQGFPHRDNIILHAMNHYNTGFPAHQAVAYRLWARVNPSYTPRGRDFPKSMKEQQARQLVAAKGKRRDPNISLKKKIIRELKRVELKLDQEQIQAAFKKAARKLGWGDAGWKVTHLLEDSDRICNRNV